MLNSRRHSLKLDELRLQLLDMGANHNLAAVLCFRVVVWLGQETIISTHANGTNTCPFHMTYTSTDVSRAETPGS
jgi:hypothetical protein